MTDDIYRKQYLGHVPDSFVNHHCGVPFTEPAGRGQMEIGWADADGLLRLAGMGIRHEWRVDVKAPGVADAWPLVEERVRVGLADMVNRTFDWRAQRRAPDIVDWALSEHLPRGSWRKLATSVVCEDEP